MSVKVLHPEFLVLIDSPHHYVKHNREETQSSRFLFRHKMRDVEIRVQIILTLNPSIIVIKIDTTFPRGFIYDMEFPAHFLSTNQLFSGFNASF